MAVRRHREFMGRLSSPYRCCCCCCWCRFDVLRFVVIAVCSSKKKLVEQKKKNFPGAQDTFVSRAPTATIVHRGGLEWCHGKGWRLGLRHQSGLMLLLGSLPLKKSETSLTIRGIRVEPATKTISRTLDLQKLEYI